MNYESQALAAVDECAAELCALSDSIWDHPEVGYHETFAAGAFCEALKKHGFEVATCSAGIPTAFCASFGSGGPVIGILAEYDALPGMSQEAGLAEKKACSEGAPGHGCGHNLLGVGALAAAFAVKEYLSHGGSGTVKFFGCPAEEGGAGKGFMARGGVFDGLDAALSWHPGDTNNVSSGSSLANYQAAYHFHGVSSHAAIAPELGRSALDAAELMNVGVQFLREHIPQDCRIHYAVTDAGGVSPGVVQAEATVLYLMRAPQLPQVRDIYARVCDIAKGAALMTGTSMDVEFIKACSNILPNKTLGLVLQRNLERLGSAVYDGEDRALAEKMRASMKKKDEYYSELVAHIPDGALRRSLAENSGAPIHDVVLPFPDREYSSFASSDVGDVSWVCPVGQLSAVTMPAGTCMHSWQEVAVGKSAMAKKGMLQAGKILAASAIELLGSPELISRAKEEKDERTGGKPYVSPIPADVGPRI